MSDKAQNVSCTIMTVHQHDVGSIKTEYNYSCPCRAILVRGGPFDMWVVWFFLRDQTFFRLPAYNFFRPYQKQTIFFSAVKLKTIFFTIYFI